MNRYICLSCSRFCYSSAGPESMRDNRCPYTGCKGTVVLARENQKCLFVVAHGIMPVRAAAIGLSLIYAAIV